SVVSTLPSDTRTTVAVPGSLRRPEKNNAPSDFISSSSTPIALQDCCICSSVIGSPTSPSTLWTDNRYWAIVILSFGWGGLVPPHPYYGRQVPGSTCIYKKMAFTVESRRPSRTSRPLRVASAESCLRPTRTSPSATSSGPAPPPLLQQDRGCTPTSDTSSPAGAVGS